MQSGFIGRVTEHFSFAILYYFYSTNCLTCILRVSLFWLCLSTNALVQSSELIRLFPNELRSMLQRCCKLRGNPRKTSGFSG